MSKSEKSAYLRQVFADNLSAHFFKLFLRIRNQREILRFFIPILKYFNISTFCNIRSQMRKKRLKKSKKIFCKCVLDFNFAPITGSVFFIFKKKSNSLYPNTHLPQSPFTGKFFWMTTFCFGVYKVN